MAGQVQTAPIDEPRGQEEPAHRVVKGSKAIREQHQKCFTRLSVNAGALFTAHRWTLNADAAETLDVLGPSIAKSGKHPARIEVYTAASNSEKENRDVAGRRALTIRTWLIDNGFLPKDTTIEGFSGKSANARQTHSPKAPNKATQRSANDNNGTVDVLIQLCSE